MDDFFEFIVSMFFVGILLIGGPVLVIRQIDRHMGPNGCKRFGESSQREVKFVQNTFWDYGCYAKTGDKYLPIDQLRGVKD